MQTTTLAFRNLGRNTRRTLITGFALALSTALFIAYYAVVDGMNAQLVHSLTRFDLGHLQVHARGWLVTHALDKTVVDPKRMLDAVKADPAVRAASSRAYAPALAGARSHSTGVLLVGIDPRSERSVTELHHRLTEGAFLDDAPTPWPEPRALTASEQQEDARITQGAARQIEDEIDALPGLQGDDGALGGSGDAEPSGEASIPGGSARSAAPTDDRDTGARAQLLSAALSPRPQRPPRVVLGHSLARVLGVSVGDELFVSAQGMDGSAEGVRVVVLGIYETGTTTYDRTRIYLHLTDLQRLTHLGGQVHEIAAVMETAGEAPGVAGRLGPKLPSLDVRDWGALRPDMVRLLDLNRGSSAFLAVIVLFVAALGVVNTMLMSVHERTRELGVLKAIGMSGTRIFAMIVVETALLAFVAGCSGVLVGLALDGFLVHHGIDLSFMTSGISFGGVVMQPVVYGEITPGGVLWPVVILAAVCLGAAIYPAARAASLAPAVGMRET